MTDRKGRTIEYDKILNFNRYMVNCMANILSRTKAKAIAERRLDPQKEAEYQNDKITGINYQLVNLLAVDGPNEINADNTKIPSKLAKKIASYMTGLPIKTKFEKLLESEWPICKNLILNLNLQTTIFILLTLLFYSQNIEYFTNQNQMIPLQFKRDFAEVVDLEILKNIFDVVKEIHTTNYPKNFLNPGNIAAVNQMSKEPIGIFRHRQAIQPGHKSNPFKINNKTYYKNHVEQTIQPIYVRQQPPRTKPPKNYGSLLTFNSSYPTPHSHPQKIFSAAKKLDFSATDENTTTLNNPLSVNLPEPPALELELEPAAYASSSILPQSSIPNSKNDKYPNASNGPSSKKQKSNSHQPFGSSSAENYNQNFLETFNLSNVFGNWNKI
jgi:hypothetical protein